MLLYKLRKLFKLKKWEIILGSLQISFIASFISQFFLLYMWNEEFSKSEKRQMFVASLILSLINLFSIYQVSNYFDFNVVVSIFVGTLINFLIYILPALIFIIIMDWSDVELTTEEIRDAKLDRVLRKLF
jgi:hypothetical protein